MFETSFIELDSRRYYSNLAYLKSKFAEECEITLVIKGNAYGHGAKEIMGLAQGNDYKSFAVFSADEAFQIYDQRRETDRLMIMGDIDFEQISWAIENGVEFFVNNTEVLICALKTARKLSKQAKIHLEFETGMNRLGFEKDEFPTLFSSLEDYAGDIDIKGVCTHLAGAESMTNFKRIRSQIASFTKICRQLEVKKVSYHQRHVACSAVALRFPKSRYEMIRLGILQYGLWPSHESFIEYITSMGRDLDPLQRIITWKSRVMSTKNVSKGQYIGYGTSFLTNSNRRLAVIPVGYTNGYARALSNQGRVLIRGQQAPVVGTVNMNALTVDVTDIPSVESGDEVVLIGKQGDQTITISSFANFSEQLNYELLSRLPRDIPRIIV